MENPNLDSIRVMSRMADIPIEATEIVGQWLLLTYDIPKSEAGDKARREFLNKAYSIGATQHTASVYYMPWTPEAENLAFEVAKVGRACVWTSKATDDDQAVILTKNYDTGLEKLLDKIAERIDKVQNQWKQEHFKRAEKMAQKTRDMMDKLLDAVERRGSADLQTYATILDQRLRVLE